MSTLMNANDRQQVSELIDTLADRPVQGKLEDGVTVFIESLPDGRFRAAAWTGRNSVARLHDQAWIAVERAVNGVRDMIDEEP